MKGFVDPPDKRGGKRPPSHPTRKLITSNHCGDEFIVTKEMPGDVEKQKGKIPLCRKQRKILAARKKPGESKNSNRFIDSGVSAAGRESLPSTLL